MITIIEKKTVRLQGARLRGETTSYTKGTAGSVKSQQESGGTAEELTIASTIRNTTSTQSRIFSTLHALEMLCVEFEVPRIEKNKELEPATVKTNGDSILVRLDDIEKDTYEINDRLTAVYTRFLVILGYDPQNSNKVSNS